jgi:hypothetical protein
MITTLYQAGFGGSLKQKMRRLSTLAFFDGYGLVC